MAYAHVVWDELPWQAGNHPLEHKKVAPGSSSVLLMFMPGFADPNVCHRSHVLQVLEGTLTVELGATTVRVESGEALLLARDTPHRARNEHADPAIVLAISDLEIGGLANG